MPEPSSPSSTPLAPLPLHSVIGVLGSGQLGKMLVQAASRLGFRTSVYADDAGPAFDIAGMHAVGPYTNLARLDEFARGVDVVTYEFENVPVDAAEHLIQRVPVRPGPLALRVAQDRVVEKNFINDLGISVAPYVAIPEGGALREAERMFSIWAAPAILKTARLGYDGKGQIGVANPSELAAAFDALGRVPCVLEQRLAFVYEVSVLVARGLDGQLACYDVPRNEHGDGILRRSIVPSGLPLDVEHAACRMAERISTALDYVGVLGVELFYLGPTAPTSLVVNEIAPRVHNSGHWTMDACAVGQFENHIRAVAGWPLAPTTRHSDAEMVNLIGPDVDKWRELAAQPEACLHLYGKREAMPGRKMGHVNYLRRLTG